MEKTVNVEAKTILQSFFITRNIDSRCARGNRPARKEEKDPGGKNKSTDFAPADTSSGKQISSTQHASSAHLKKDHCGGPRRKSRQGQDLSAMGVNAIPKKKEDLSQVESSTVERMAILPTSVFKKRNRSQKTSIGLGNLHVNDWC